MHSDSTPEIPYGYCQCGCGRKTNISSRTDRNKGHIKDEPVRFLIGHKSRDIGTPYAKLFVEQDCGYTTPCWVWKLCKSSDGYGRYRVAGKMVQAHRWMYERHVGPIPEGLQLDHLCRNPSCVNPEHLEPVTPQVNTLRGETIPARNAAKTHCIRGHAFTPENTVIDPNGGRSCRICHRMTDKRRYERNRAQRMRKGC